MNLIKIKHYIATNESALWLAESQEQYDVRLRSASVVIAILLNPAAYYVSIRTGAGRKIVERKPIYVSLHPSQLFRLHRDAESETRLSRPSLIYQQSLSQSKPPEGGFLWLNNI